MQSQVTRPSTVKEHPTLKMRALQYQGKESLKMVEVPRPMVTDPTDAVVKGTATSIGGSDLKLYHDLIPGMTKGDTIGHECVGIVEDVGSEVTKFKKGDRVVISSVIACGQCDYCKRHEWSCCDTTNISEPQEKLYGHRTGAMFGCGRTFGGYGGCQAEYVRVPFAQVNLFPIPDKVSDKDAGLVADVASTALHANVLADVKQGDRVVVLGCGPVGLLTQMWARSRGASIVVAIDVDQQRLDFAKEKFGSTIVNCEKEDTLDRVESLIPGGPDKVIDCVGSQSPESFLQKVQMKLKVEKDAPNVVNLAIKMVRKNGRITLIGDYSGYTDHFNIGGLMEKHLTINGGQVWPHTYHNEIMTAMTSGKINPGVVITHTFPMSKLPEVYRMVHKHENGIIKAVIVPDEMYQPGKEKYVA